MRCATWGCARDADWRYPWERFGFCRAHAPADMTWPVSAWALDQPTCSSVAIQCLGYGLEELGRADELRVRHEPGDAAAAIAEAHQ